LTIQGELIAGSSYAVLRPAAIYGGNEVSLEGNILLDSPVDLASDTTIGAADLKPFGETLRDPLSQLAKINGGTVAFSTAVPVLFDIPNMALNTIVTTAGLVTFSEDTILNKKLVAGTAGYRIAAGKKLTIGQYGGITAGTALVIGPGVYAAEDGPIVISNAGAIGVPTGTSSASLKVGGSKDGNTEKFIFKASAANSFAATATAANRVTLNGELGGLVIPGGGTAATITIGANADLVLGNGATIGFGFDTNGGSIIFTDATSKISGFDTEGTSIPAGTAEGFRIIPETEPNKVGKPWEFFTTGLDWTTAGSDITYGDKALKGGASNNTVSGATPNGGILRKTSI
jgi:hypothetical protein